MSNNKPNVADGLEEERYINSMHRLGRLGMLGAILIMLGMPTILGIYFDALPSVKQIFQAAFPLLMIFVPSSLFEVITYTPILGSSIYLTLITGEVLNLKLPVANNAIKVMDVEPGTEAADIVSSIAVSVASFVTVAVVTAGVLLALPLKTILAWSAVRIASAHVFPALFGALLVSLLGRELGGGIRVYGRSKGLILPVAVLALITFFDPQISSFLHLDRLLHQEGQGVIMTTLQGLMIIVMLPLSYLSTKWLYRKKHIQVCLPGEERKNRRDEALLSNEVSDQQL